MEKIDLLLQHQILRFHMKQAVFDLSGSLLISIGKMSEKSGVSTSAIRGYEKLGLLRQYNIAVIRNGRARYFRPEDAWKLAHIKETRLMNRNEILAAQGGSNSDDTY